MCLNPHSEIDVSRANDNGTLMIFITDNNSPISTPGLYGTMCMGYAAGNCVNPSGYCATMLGGYASDYTSWSIKCVSDP